MFSHLSPCTGICFMDSTALRLCANKGIVGHRVFEGVAHRGKTPVSGCYGFKVPLLVHTSAEGLSFALTAGTVADNSKALVTELVGTTKLWGKLLGDKGYSSSQVQQTLGEGNI